MPFTRVFEELDQDDAMVAGGKGASLGELTRVGIPVPPGFVVTAQAFEEFLRATDLNVELDAILDGVDHNAIHTVDEASRKIQALIGGASLPQEIASEITEQHQKLGSGYVAVRSSATSEDSAQAAWAGQLDSFLNVTAEGLLEHVQKCWASLYTPRAIFYRFEKGMHRESISVAVVIQKMVASEASGIAFSVHPVTQDPDQLIIEAGFGLGEAIVQGAITPDSYVIEKSVGRIIDRSIFPQKKGIFRGSDGGSEWQDIPESRGSQPSLADDQAIDLANLVVGIEQHYGFPVDVEWAHEGGKFYIVQSRPITTLDSSPLPTAASPVEYAPGDYVRMFANKSSFVYLLSDIFMQHYKSLNVLSIQDERAWISFLPKGTQELTLQEGYELYTSEKLYRKYKKDFDTYIKTATAYFESVLAKDKIDRNEASRFFELASQHFFYYAKTEFFYTDRLDPDEMVPTLDEFEKLKLDGRSFLNKIIFEQKGYVRTLIAKLAKQAGVPTTDLFSYSIKEILELIEGQRKAPAANLKDRRVFFASKERTLFGDEARSLVDAFLSVYQNISDTIRGTTANGGRVRGKARVLVPDFDNFDSIADAVDQMEQGEVLVAETTAPEIIRACKKAAAIVTNQGGMLSHAAIVSRELGIPCIIGTDKDVILNIKTGDEIEVDANEGIVTILNKK